jgi:hypothetical protein
MVYSYIQSWMFVHSKYVVLKPTIFEMYTIYSLVKSINIGPTMVPT